MRSTVLVLAALLALGACGDSGDGAADSAADTGTPTVTATAAAVEPLPTGKSDLDVVATSHGSPEGFAPALELDLQYTGTVGWTSAHRGADAFDIGLPGVVFAFLTPAEDDAAAALAAVRADAEAAGATVRDVEGPFADLGATTGLDVRGGAGPAVASRDGGVALDATPGGRLQVYGTDEGGAPLLVAVWAPDAARWRAARAHAEALAGAVVYAR